MSPVPRIVRHFCYTKTCTRVGMFLIFLVFSCSLHTERSYSYSERASGKHGGDFVSSTWQLAYQAVPEEDLHVVYNVESIDCGCSASMLSIAMNTNKSVVFHVVLPNPDSNYRPELPANSRLVLHQLPEMSFERRPRQARLGNSHVSWARLFLPLYVPPATGRVLYLDSDTLVTGDISELFEMQFSTSVAAVQEPKTIRKWLNVSVPNVPDTARMYNSGVLLVNLPLWKAQNVTERLLELTSIQPFNNDQVIFNVLFHEIGVTQLPYRWNVFNLGCCSVKVKVEVKGVYHWSCSRKWWLKNGCNVHISRKVLHDHELPDACQREGVKK
jgi:hypothetical protein